RTGAQHRNSRRVLNWTFALHSVNPPALNERLTYNRAMRNELKRLLAASLGVALLQLIAQAEDKPTKSPSSPNGLTNQQEKVSYAVGMNFGNYLKRMGAEVDVDVLTAAVKDVLAGREMKL